MTVPPLPKSFEAAAHLQSAVERELERICSSSNFRSSRKSCEFLRYVVRVALDGRVDSLKERSIGIDLFGRDSSYDPSSDATVRVRANEVRKRLASFYAGDQPLHGYRIVLPAGRYVPQFVPWTSEPEIHEPEFALPAESTSGAALKEETEEEPAPLNVVLLMRPALIALFLCVLLLRQQIGDRGNHLLFWDHILQGRNAMTITLEGETANATSELDKSIYPLIWISGRYGIYPLIEYRTSRNRASADDTNLHISFISPPELVADRRIPFLITEANGIRTLVGRSHPQEKMVPERAALLIVLPSQSNAVWIQGTDNEAIQNLTESLIQEHNFPASLNTAISQKLPVEVVMSLGTNGLWTAHTYGPVS